MLKLVIAPSASRKTRLNINGPVLAHKMQQRKETEIMLPLGNRQKRRVHGRGSLKIKAGEISVMAGDRIKISRWVWDAFLFVGGKWVFLKLKGNAGTKTEGNAASVNTISVNRSATCLNLSLPTRNLKSSCTPTGEMKCSPKTVTYSLRLIREQEKPKTGCWATVWILPKVNAKQLIPNCRNRQQRRE